MARPKKENADRLTDLELQIMNVLWDKGEGTAQLVLDQFEQDGKSLAYTTISTVLRVLEKKEFVETRKEGRSHVYIPSLQQDEYRTRTVNHVVEEVFSGNPTNLIKNLIGQDKISEDQLSELKSLLEEKSGK